VGEGKETIGRDWKSNEINLFPLTRRTLAFGVTGREGNAGGNEKTALVKNFWVTGKEDRERVKTPEREGVGFGPKKGEKRGPVKAF